GWAWRNKRPRSTWFVLVICLSGLDNMNDKRPIRFLIGCGTLLMIAIVGGAVLTAFQMHNRILTDNERELSNTALILAEHSDRALQTVELIHSSIQERIESLGIASRLDFAQRMSEEDMHLML